MLYKKPLVIMNCVFIASLLNGCVNTPVQNNTASAPKQNKGSFVTVSPNGKKIRSYYYLPKNTLKSSPVIIVMHGMHGMHRNVKDYRRNWQAMAEKYGFAILVPKFSGFTFPNKAYNSGNIYSAYDKLLPKEKWSFSAIEPIFDNFKQLKNLSADQYMIFGHSAGSQFVHRFMTFINPNRACHAIAANAGWYTFLDLSSKFPYGLAGVPINEVTIDTMLAKRITILLGEEDNDPEHSSLRKSHRAMQQGDHRLERGKNYFEYAKELADYRNVSFNWQLQTVPNIAHNNSEMAVAAARIFSHGCQPSLDKAQVK